LELQIKVTDNEPGNSLLIEYIGYSFVEEPALFWVAVSNSDTTDMMNAISDEICSKSSTSSENKNFRLWYARSYQGELACIPGINSI
jgi:hypothetical protein